MQVRNNGEIEKGGDYRDGEKWVGWMGVYLSVFSRETEPMGCIYYIEKEIYYKELVPMGSPKICSR